MLWFLGCEYASAMDAKVVALKGLQSAVRLFGLDLEALPEEAFTRKFGEKTRTVADIVYEINLVNDHIGMVMRGEEPFAWPEGDWIAAPADWHSKEQIISEYQTSTERILQTVEGFSAEDMEAPLTTENGETTRFERCRFMTVHLFYHSGQLNFIQTLLGDDQMHWS
jgi:uncharacterized damage-inducible protein DinB